MNRSRDACRSSRPWKCQGPSSTSPSMSRRMLFRRSQRGPRWSGPPTSIPTSLASSSPLSRLPSRLPGSAIHMPSRGWRTPASGQRGCSRVPRRRAYPARRISALRGCLAAVALYLIVLPPLRWTTRQYTQDPGPVRARTNGMAGRNESNLHSPGPDAPSLFLLDGSAAPQRVVQANVPLGCGVVGQR